MRRSCILTLSIAMVGCICQGSFGQRSPYPTEYQSSYYSRNTNDNQSVESRPQMDRSNQSQSDRYRPGPDRYQRIADRRDLDRRYQQENQIQEREGSRRLPPAYSGDRLYSSSRQGQEQYRDDRYGQDRRQAERRGSYERRDQFDQSRQSSRPGNSFNGQRRYEPARRPETRDRYDGRGRFSPVGYQQDGNSGKRPELAPPRRSVQEDPALRPPGRTNQRLAPPSNDQLRLHDHAPDVPRVDPSVPQPTASGHPSDCGCSSCSSGYRSGSHSYNGCDSGCDAGGDGRYTRYFQSGYDRMARSCVKGLCGGCSSCLGRGRRGRRRSGGCLSGCGQSGCNGGCFDGGCGISSYEYKFYGPRPSGGCDSYGDCGDCGSDGCDSGCGDCYSNPFAESGGSVHKVFGASWLLLRRDAADYYPLSYENAMPTNRLLLDAADQSAQNGVEVFYGHQSDCGNGWEIRYWGLYENQSDAFLGNMPQTELEGLAHVNFGGAGHVQSLFNSSDFHGLTRDSQLHNAEFNIFRIASGCGPRRKFIIRGLGGFRVINFQDEFQYFAHNATFWGGTFNRVNYDIDTNNTILATQLGATGEYCVSPRIRLSLGAKAGVGANLIAIKQQITNSHGAYGQNVANADFCYDVDQTDVSVFGELNTSLLYHVSDCFRVRVGYRIFGITGVALAHDQIPYDFRDVQELNNVKSDGSIFYHGLQLGGEFCY